MITRLLVIEDLPAFIRGGDSLRELPTAAGREALRSADLLGEPSRTTQFSSEWAAVLS